MKILVGLFLVLSLIGTVPTYAEKLHLNVKKMIVKMQKELSLSDEQVVLIKPIIERDVLKRQELSESLSEYAIDKAEIRKKIRQLREEENLELSKILTQEQMQKMLNKQHLRDSLNKDKIDFSDGYGDVGLNIEGGSFKF